MGGAKIHVGELIEMGQVILADLVARELRGMAVGYVQFFMHLV